MIYEVNETKLNGSLSLNSNGLISKANTRFATKHIPSMRRAYGLGILALLTVLNIISSSVVAGSEHKANLERADNPAAVVPRVLQSSQDVPVQAQSKAVHDAQALQHKNLIPLTSRDILLIVLAAATTFLAAGAGIGGGGILLPVYMWIGGEYTCMAAC